MATISHEPARVPEQHRWAALLVSEMWASIAIAVIWLSVLFDAVYGPDLEAWGVSGDHAVIPSLFIVAPFAFFATWVVAKYRYRHEKE
jgi:hypothetical protein